MVGVRYFGCKAKYGMFVRPDKLVLDKRGPHGESELGFCGCQRFYQGKSPEKEEIGCMEQTVIPDDGCVHLAGTGRDGIMSRSMGSL
ncbi:hypothetical protein HPB50_022548 [Hyalomma asiaticum]|uniref:Uncharacterized protein n=1 Tax=Hyalomma asiaticum TaxID=266040 RepID=A0ACB7RV52_HYAAI|nr:hypothetical protein HPB50_022548 [Hyalomma asiaticum]